MGKQTPGGFLPPLRCCLSHFMEDYTTGTEEPADGDSGIELQDDTGTPDLQHPSAGLTEWGFLPGVDDQPGSPTCTNSSTRYKELLSST
ncbi:hypothetical protein FALBO_14427 [Fusarium albosuccineum]|uniref:Uncharacterized protein n=1 Tax=Fusarium albosuccineum TaxID=1237068 RepID=A0A8H4KZ93_9HYPO|nr:hypothetical protein FALBO_14427 [Fusarium albosuccineum]